MVRLIWAFFVLTFVMICYLCQTSVFMLSILCTIGSICIVYASLFCNLYLKISNLLESMLSSKGNKADCVFPTLLISLLHFDFGGQTNYFPSSSLVVQKLIRSNVKTDEWIYGIQLQLDQIGSKFSIYRIGRFLDDDT